MKKKRLWSLNAALHARIVSPQLFCHQQGGQTPGPVEQLVLLYHLGVQKLLLGQQRDALACFEGSRAALSTHYQLWLRLAECVVDISASRSDCSRLPVTDAHSLTGSSEADCGDQGQLDQAAQWLQRAAELLEEQLAQPCAEPEALQQLQADHRQVQTRWVFSPYHEALPDICAPSSMSFSVLDAL